MEEQILKWGVFAVTPYTAGIIVAVLVAVFMTLWEGSRINLPVPRVLNFTVMALLGGILGARISYILLFDWEHYRQNPLEILTIQDGGMSFYGAVLAGFIVVLLWSIIVRVPLQRYLDVAAPSLAVAAALGRIGLAPQGVEASSYLPWSLVVNNKEIHPDQAYLIALFLILAALLLKRRQHQRYHGELFVWFLLGGGIIEFVIGFVREELVQVGIFNAGQLAALALFLLGLVYRATGQLPIPRRSAFKFKKGGSKIAKAGGLLLLGLFIAGTIAIHIFLVRA